MAPGSQKCSGTIADLDSAPINTSATPIDAASPGRRIGDQFGQQVGAAGGAEDDDADEHRQPARGGDQQRLGGRPPAGGALGVVADQQERQDGGQFPEQVEHQHVVADHQAEHRAGERDEFGRETGQALLGVTVVMVEVLRAVEEHQRADAEHQDAHDRGERVEPQRDVHRQLRHPVEVDTVRRPDRASSGPPRPGSRAEPAPAGRTPAVPNGARAPARWPLLRRARRGWRAWHSESAGCQPSRDMAGFVSRPVYGAGVALPGRLLTRPANGGPERNPRPILRTLVRPEPRPGQGHARVSSSSAMRTSSLRDDSPSFEKTFRRW